MNLYNTKTRKIDPIDDEEALQQALLSGTHSFEAGTKVEVLNPAGERGTVPAENVAEAIKAGYKIETPTQRTVREYVRENDGLKGDLKVGLGQLVDEAALGIPEMIFDKTGNPLDVAKKEALKKEHDLANTLGGITGFGASLLTGGPLWKAGSKVGEKVTAHVAEKLAVKAGEEVGSRTIKSAAKDIVGRMASKAAGAGVEGGIVSLPHAITEAALGDPGDAAETVLAGVGIGTLLGGGGALAKDFARLSKEAVLKGAGLVTSQKETIKSLARKGVTVATGVPEGDLEYYLLNPDRVNAAPEREAIKDRIDEGYAKLKTAVDVKREQLIQAQRQMDEAYTATYADLTNPKTDREAVSTLMGAADEQKKVLGSLSEQAEDALARMKGTISKKEIEKLVVDQIETLRVGGRGGLTDEAIEDLVEEFGESVLKQVENNGAIVGEVNKAAEGYLNGLLGDLQKLPEQLTGSEARQIMRGLRLDAQKSFGAGAGAFDTVKERLIKNISEPLSNKLKKKSLEYDQYMGRMWAISKNLSKVSRLVKTENKTAQTIQKMFTDKGTFDREAIEELAALTGKDLLAPLEKYRLKVELKEAAKRGDITDKVVPELYGKVKRLEAEFKLAEQAFEPVRRLTPERTQAIILNQGYKNASIENRRALEALSKIEGEDFLTLIKDRNVRDSFSKERPNGSRRTLLGTMLGSLAGGPLGAPIGAAAGATVDVYGGEILKRLIDANRNVAGLLFSEKAMKRAAEKIDEIPGMLSRMSERAKPKAMRSAVGYGVLRLMISDTEEKPSEARRIPDRIRDLDRVRDKAAVLVSDPSAAAEKITELTRPISEGGAPGIGEALAQKASVAMNYLYKEMPKPPRPRSPFAPKVPYKPSDSEIAAFEDKAQVAADPFSVLTELEHGTLTRHHIDALKAIYPGIHKMIVGKIQSAVVDGVKPLTYAQRVKLSLLIDAPLDVSLEPRAVAYYQEAHGAVEEAEKQRAAGGGAFKAKVDVSTQQMTNLDRLASK